MTTNPNSKWRRQCSIEGSGNNKEEPKNILKLGDSRVGTTRCSTLAKF
jgi:ATP-dependent protease HslVU (ClpYQ) ATPase subunit